MSAEIKLINSVAIPHAQGVQRRAFKADARDLINILHLPTSEAHTLDIQRVHGGVITLQVDNNASSLVTNPDVHACCERILNIAGGFLPRQQPVQERAPLSGRAPSPTRTDPAPLSETSSSTERAPHHLNPSLDTLEARIKHLTRLALHPLEQENARLHQHLRAAGQERAGFIQNSRELSGHVEGLLAEKEELENQLQAMTEQAEGFRLGSNELRHALEEHGADREAHLKLIAEQQQKIARLTGELERVQTKLQKAQEQNRTIWERADLVNKQNLATIADLQTQLYTQETALSDLDQQNAALQQENTSLKALGEKQLPLIRAAREELEQLKQDLANKDQTDGAMSQAQAAGIEKLITERNALAERLERMTQIANDLRATGEQTRAKLASQDKEFQELYEKLQKKTVTALADAERENENLRGQLKMSRHHSSGKALADANATNQKLIQERNALREANAAANGRIAALEKQIQDDKAAIEELARVHSTELLKIAGMLKAQSKAKQFIGMLEKDNAFLSDRVLEVEERLRAAQKELDKFRAAGLSARGMSQAEKESLHAIRINTAEYRLHNIYYAKTKDFLTDEQKRELAVELVDTMTEQNLSWVDLDEDAVYDEIIKPYFESLGKQGSDEST